MKNSKLISEKKRYTERYIQNRFDEIYGSNLE